MTFSARDLCIYCSICVLGVKDGGLRTSPLKKPMECVFGETQSGLHLRQQLEVSDHVMWLGERLYGPFYSEGAEKDLWLPPWGRGQSLLLLLYLAFSIVSVTLALISNTSFQ